MPVVARCRCTSPGGLPLRSVHDRRPRQLSAGLERLRRRRQGRDLRQVGGPVPLRAMEGAGRGGPRGRGPSGRDRRRQGWGVEAPGRRRGPEESLGGRSRAIDEITADPEALAKEIDGPTGKMPAGEIIGQFVTMDVLVHTWDLARAVGADERLDEDSVRQAYEVLKPMDAMIRQPNVFGPKLESPPGCRSTDGVPLLPRPSGVEASPSSAVAPPTRPI